MYMPFFLPKVHPSVYIIHFRRGEINLENVFKSGGKKLTRSITVVPVPLFRLFSVLSRCFFSFILSLSKGVCIAHPVPVQAVHTAHQEDAE